jgi:hypothetical protein
MDSRWLLYFEAIDPKNLNGKTWKVGVHQRHYKFLQNRGHEKSLARLLLVREVLQGGTTLLYEGWGRPGKEEKCYVYVGHPKTDYKSLSIETCAPPEMVFLVFVLSDGTIDDWTWRRIAENEDGTEVPSDIKGKLIWSQNRNSRSS